MSLYKKYRPLRFLDILGNETTIQSLEAVLRRRPQPHAYLFSGPTGCGKTTLARIVAKILGCRGSDFREIDTADFRGIDTVREIRKQARFMPLEGPCKVWLLDECHKLTEAGQPALLKMLEDPPEHVYFILATTDPQKLLPTVKGRCQQFQVSPLNDQEMSRLLRRVTKEEGESLEKRVCDQIIQDSQGHPRNALQILEQVLGVDSEKRLEVARRSAEIQSQTIELCRALIRGADWKEVRRVLSGLREQDAEGIRRAVLGYCNSILLKEENTRAALIMEEFIRPFYDSGFPGLTLACYSVVCGER
jgi:DNA polymerase-3 subunit gamma/tau